MADTESKLLEHLEFLYGPAAGSALEDLLQLMRSFDGRLDVGPQRQLAADDIALIAYGDMVREAGRSPLGSLGEFLAEHVGDVINTVHLLPFFPYSSDDGFSVIDYLEVDPALGDWHDLANMRDSFRLMFDAVLNHISASSSWFDGFRSGDVDYQDFFTVVDPGLDVSEVFRPRELPLLTEVDTAQGPRHVWTTFSADQIDLNYKNPEVLLASVEVLLTYVSRGAELIRLDAVTFLWKEFGTSCIHLPQTHHIIQLWRAVLDEVAPGVTIITETNVPHEENVSYFGDGTNEAHLVYNFALPPLVLQAFHSGDAGVLTRWAGEVRSPSPATTFFNFLASHDGIGVGGARGYLSEEQIGEMAARTKSLGGDVSYRVVPDGTRVPYELNINYLDALGDPTGADSAELTARRFLTSQAVMLALQGVPAIYFHSLFGSRGWPDGVAETGAFRAVNREKLSRQQLENELKTEGSLRDRVFGGYRELLRARASHSAFAPGARQQVLTLDGRVFAVLRGDGESSVLCLHNVSADDVSIDVAGALADGPLRNLSGGQPAQHAVELGAYETAWLKGGSS